MLKLHQIPVLSDNYVYLIHDEDSDQAAVIDPAEAQPVLKELDRLGLKLAWILNTHHHWDHVGGNEELVAQTGCSVMGASHDAARIPEITRKVSDGELVDIFGATAKVIAVPGHTTGHIAYWFEQDKMLFCGDTLFALGCGRLFEGDGPTMWDSLLKFKALPDDTQIVCAHEYTLANSEFALHLDKDNDELLDRVIQLREMRDEGKPTVPCLLGDEKRTNPFLRADAPSLAAQLNMVGASHAEIFTEIRARKDKF